MTDTETKPEDNQVSPGLDYLDFEMLMGMRAQSMGRDQNELIDKMRSIPPELVLAYKRTQFIVQLETGDHIVYLSDEVPAAINELLQSAQATSWTIISAMNPHSQQITSEENVRRNQLLQKLLELQNAKTFPAVGKCDSGAWEEQSFFVLGLSYEMAQALGTVFQQNALLYGEKDAVVELIFCDR